MKVLRWPVTIERKYTKEDLSEACVKFFYTSSIDPIEDKSLHRCIAKTYIIKRVNSNNSHNILLDNHTIEGEFIFFNYE